MSEIVAYFEHVLTERLLASPDTVYEIHLVNRFAGMWMLAATTGMRRSELAGVARDQLNLTDRTLAVHDTCVVVAGRVVSTDGRRMANHTPRPIHARSTDRSPERLLDAEQEAFGDACPSHRKLMCFRTAALCARTPSLAGSTGSSTGPRATDPTARGPTHIHNGGPRCRIEPKIVSDRVGHANVGITLSSTPTEPAGRDREAALRVGALIGHMLDANKGTKGAVNPEQHGQR